MSLTVHIKKYKLKVNVTKNKVRVFESNSNTEYATSVDGRELENVSTFKHLGSVDSKNGGTGKEVREKAQRGERVIATLRTVTRF